MSKKPKNFFRLAGLYKRPSWKGRGNSSLLGDLEPVLKAEVKLDTATPEEK